jgi:hypothetical protein
MEEKKEVCRLSQKGNWAPLYDKQCDFTVASDVSDIIVPLPVERGRSLGTRR